MMWAIAIKRKITAALVLLVVMLIVLLTNLSERKNATTINTAVASMYKDRLLVEGYIFDYARALHKVEEIIESPTPPESKYNAAREQFTEIANLSALYEKTTLTPDEKVHFAAFQKQAAILEDKLKAARIAEADEANHKANEELFALSEIQIREGKAAMDKVTSASSFSGVVSEIELVVLIVLAIIIQILVLTSKGLNTIVMPKKPSMN